MKNKNKFGITYGGKKYTFNKKLFKNNLLTFTTYVIVMLFFICIAYYGLTNGCTVGQHLA